MIPDRVEAIRLLLLADSEVNSSTAARVYGGEVPENQSGLMPRLCVVVKHSGGVGSIGQAFQNYSDSRVDVICYGATPKTASDLYRSIFPVLKQLQAEIHAGCLLHWARDAGGPVSMRDADTNWPFVFSSWQILASDIPA